MTSFANLARPSKALLTSAKVNSLGRSAFLSTSPAKFRANKFDTINPAAVKLFSKEESRAFMSVFPDLVRDLTVEGLYKDMPAVNKHLAQCIQYNVPNGKKNRGMTVPISYKLIASKEDQTEDNLRLANILGWCVEFLQAFFLVADDIMDGSKLRRGQPAWYTKDDVGLMAVNDSLLLESCVYAILSTHFSDKPYYSALVNEFQETTRHTCMGQSLDLLTANKRTADGRVDIDAFDMKTHAAIVKFKTSYYTFCLPGALAMNMAGITDPQLYQQAKTIYLEMGRFFQVQDDYLDCFGDPAVTGKDGTDIQDGKCSWMIAVAMQRADKNQKDALREAYGSQDPQKVARVKEIYEELNLRKIYKKFEDSLYEDIILHVKQIKGEGQLLPPQLFTRFLDRIYQRKK